MIHKREILNTQKLENHH